MKKTTTIIAGIAFILLTGLVVSGCRKNDRDKDTETTSARDNAIAENAFAGIFKAIGEFTDSTSLLRAAGCATYTVDSVGTTSWPKTLTINYGTVNCACADGNLRRGKIIASFSGRYRDSLTVITISTINYYHNNSLVQAGTHTITNNGHNAADNLSYTIYVQNASIASPNGNITWNSSRTREWIAGDSTITDPMDDVYSIVGTANGTSSNGNGFNVVVYNPLIVAMNCPYIKGGALSLSPFNLSTRYVDFGSGTCDNTVIITINGTPYTVTL
jgi:hypothetical protein